MQRWEKTTSPTNLEEIWLEITTQDPGLDRPKKSDPGRVFYSLHKNISPTYPVADPGFSPGGGANSQNCYYFSHFCRKLHENERIWTPRGGRASLASPLGSANAIYYIFLSQRSLWNNKQFTPEIGQISLFYLCIDFLIRIRKQRKLKGRTWFRYVPSIRLKTMKLNSR